MVGLEWYPCCTLKPATRIPHIEPEQCDRCGNSTTQSQVPDDVYINVRNMLST